MVFFFFSFNFIFYRRLLNLHLPEQSLPSQSCMLVKLEVIEMNSLLHICKHFVIVSIFSSGYKYM